MIARFVLPALLWALCAPAPGAAQTTLTVEFDKADDALRRAVYALRLPVTIERLPCRTGAIVCRWSLGHAVEIAVARGGRPGATEIAAVHANGSSSTDAISRVLFIDACRAAILMAWPDAGLGDIGREVSNLTDWPKRPKPDEVRERRFRDQIIFAERHEPGLKDFPDESLQRCGVAAKRDS